MTPEEADDAAFEAELAAERETLHAAALTPADPDPEPTLLDVMAAAVADGTFDPECDRCNYARHLCPGCGTDLHHGLDVCSACLDWLAEEQVLAAAALERRKVEAQVMAERRLAKALEQAGDVAEPEPVDVTAVIEEARRDLRLGRG